MAAYTQCLRCAGAPRRPAGGSGLSLPFLLGMPLSMTPGSSIIASPELRCRHGLRRDLSSSALPILPQSVSRGAHISGLPDSRICYGLPSCSPPLYGSDRCTRPPRAFTSRLPTDRSPSPLPDISTTATGLLCWRDFHPLEWQLASLHQNCRAGSIDSRRRGAAQPPRCATTDLASLNCDPPFLPIPMPNDTPPPFLPHILPHSLAA
jgi:hypothetical protein